ncbi:MAG: outer membrane lipoprotein carrier protein LolA [Luteolibacter sp.]
MRFLLLFFSFLPTLHAQDAVLENWLKRQAEITTLQAKFTQERKLPALKNPVVTPGRLAFAKPGKLRWQLGEPAQTLAVSDGKTLSLIQIDDKKARQIDADSPQAARYALLTGKAFESLQAFTRAFEIIEKRQSHGIHQYTLKPKDRKFRLQVPWIFLDIDPAKNELRAMEMELQDKSRIRTLFRNPVFNQTISESTFTPDLSGYQVIGF